MNVLSFLARESVVLKPTTLAFSGGLSEVQNRRLLVPNSGIPGEIQNWSCTGRTKRGGRKRQAAPAQWVEV